MLKLPSLIETVPGVHHSLYADDITLWTSGGREADIEERLQQAVDIIDSYITVLGLQCSPTKSEFLVYTPPGMRNGCLPEQEPDIELTVQGLAIPRVSCMRVLGLRIQERGQNTETLKALTSSAQQIGRMILRISHKHHGLKERNLLRLVQAFIISRITYVTPYLFLKKSDQKSLDCLIRKAYKQALGLPVSTSTERLMAMGVHNTLGELIEAHRQAQIQRLAGTKTGRKLLAKLHISPTLSSSKQADLPPDLRDRIYVAPLPRNMHPVFHEERRRARAAALQKKIRRMPMREGRE